MAIFNRVHRYWPDRLPVLERNPLTRRLSISANQKEVDRARHKHREEQFRRRRRTIDAMAKEAKRKACAREREREGARERICLRARCQKKDEAHSWPVVTAGRRGIAQDPGDRENTARPRRPRGASRPRCQLNRLWTESRRPTSRTTTTDCC